MSKGTNFFDQFDDPANTPSIATPAGADPLLQQASPTGLPELGSDVTSTANAFDDIEQGKTFPDMTEDEFNREAYERLRRGDSAEDIIAWSKQTPFTIVDSMDFRRNVIARDKARETGQDPAFGRIQHNKYGVSVPTMGNLDTAALMATRAANLPLFNFGDEAAAAIRAVGQQGGFLENYEDNHRELAELDDVMATANPGAATMGDAIGIGASMLAPGAIVDNLGAKVLSRLGMSQPAKLGGRMAIGAGAGGISGAVSATGEGTPDDRFKNTGGGFVLGTAFGTSFPLAEAAFRRVARPVMERLSPNHAKALADRTALTREELAQVEKELQRQKDLGLEPTLLDVLPERARRVVGSAGRHDSAREQLQDFAESRVEALPERVMRVSDEEIRPAGIESSSEEMQIDLQKQRNADIEAALDPIRLTPLPITDDIMDILGTEAGQQAIQNIVREMPDMARRQAYLELLDNVSQRARTRDPRLSEDAQQKAFERLREDTNFDLDMSERIGRELKRMADVGEGSPGLREMGRKVRAAAEISPVYREAMADYGAASRSVDAVTVGSGRNTVMDEYGRVQRIDDEGQGFLNEDPERFQRRFNELLEKPEMKQIDADVPLKGRIELHSGYPSDSPALTYIREDGTSVNARLSMKDGGREAYVEIIGQPSTWDRNRGTFSNADIIDMMRAVKRQYPSVEKFTGHRITGVHSRNAMQQRIRGQVDDRTRLDVIDEVAALAEGRMGSSAALQRYLENLTPVQLRNLERTFMDEVEFYRSNQIMNAARKMEARLQKFREEVGDRMSSEPQFLGSYQEIEAPRMTRKENRPRVRLQTGTKLEEAIVNNGTSPAEQDAAIQSWINSDLVSMDLASNGSRRVLTPEQRRTYEAIEDAIAQRGVEAPPLLYRGLRFNSEADLNEFLSNPNSYNVPFSTSRTRGDAMMFAASPRVGQPGVIMDIEVPRGTRALDLTRQTDEDEFVLPAGRIEILNVVRRNGSDEVEVTAEFIPNTPRTEAVEVPTYEAAPAERDLARLGAADQVNRRAGQGPEQAARVARQIVRSPNQRQRSATMLGNRAGRLEDRMRGELSRVEVAKRQASAEGPGREGNMDGIESGVNALYNPTSPISWARESMRYLSRIGMPEDTANYIVQNATDPNRADEMLELLQKQGMKREQAEKWLAEFRDAFVKYSVLQEGNPYDRPNP